MTKLLKAGIDLDAFFQKLAKTPHALLFLDFDGTLAPFSQDPEAVRPYPEVMEKIDRIIKTGRTKVVIVSGRSLKNLKSKINLSLLPELWGSHGAERFIAGTSEVIMNASAKEIQPFLDEAAKVAATSAPDLLLEIKPFAVALHWRGIEAGIAGIQSMKTLNGWQLIAAGKPLEIHEFDGGIELRAAGVNKGIVVQTLIKEMPKGTLTAYLGDDFTDEEAFAALGPHALKLLVRSDLRNTLADVQLIPPGELYWFLDQWIKNTQMEKP
jgi:trehalose-phosphatase